MLIKHKASIEAHREVIRYFTRLNKYRRRNGLKAYTMIQGKKISENVYHTRFGFKPKKVRTK